jgi:hypothetical protein
MLTLKNKPGENKMNANNNQMIFFPSTNSWGPFVNGKSYQDGFLVCESDVRTRYIKGPESKNWEDYWSNVDIGRVDGPSTAIIAVPVIREGAAKIKAEMINGRLVY